MSPADHKSIQLSKHGTRGKKRMSKRERKEAKKMRTDNTRVALEENANSNEGYLDSYEPSELPTEPSTELLERSSHKKDQKAKNNHNDEGGEGQPKGTLGKWFPSALLIKCPLNYSNTGTLVLNEASLSKKTCCVDNPQASLVLFYQYTNAASGKPWSQTQVKLLMTYLSTIAVKRNVGGRIRVAMEGVNATVSAVDMPTISAKKSLRHFAQDLKNFDSEVFSATDFKYIDDLPADRHFKELKVIPVQELVFYDIRETDAPLDIASKEEKTTKGGIHLEAKAYHEMLKKDNTVVVDVRNHYETLIGRFDGQESIGGATYIDPMMRKSTDFKGWLEQDGTKEKLKDKKVLMFCTGGIRCERASAYLKNRLGGEVEEVYQLQGGIERYLKAYPDGGGFWSGKNFVFDKREAVSARNPNGDGGVVKRSIESDACKPSSKCCVCDDPWDRYVGKRKCWTCGVPVLMCDKCMSKKPDKDRNKRLSVRCPLCVTENVTVAAAEMELTANGIKGKNNLKQTTNERGAPQGKAADSILKWGGGHASQKKLTRKMKRIPCKYGAECTRDDCFFAHPRREPSDVSRKEPKIKESRASIT